MDAKRILGTNATTFVEDGMTLGLGTGTTAEAFLEALRDKIVQEGISVRGVPTSLRTERKARELGIPIVFEGRIDLAIDGADQVDRERFLLKGGGGAMLREKVVDYAAKEFICLIEKRKLVSAFTMPVPCEVLPFALAWVTTSLEPLGEPILRRRDGGVPFTTDNGNDIIDLRATGYDPGEMEQRLDAIPGILGNGIFSRPYRIMVVDERGETSEF